MSVRFLLSEPRATTAVLDLSANENPFGPSPRALAAIADAAAHAHRYPDKEGAALKEALARRLRVHVEQIFLGNGSCEVLEAIARATLRPGDRALVVEPSFPAYRSIIARTGATAVAAPLEREEDPAALATRVCERTRLVILANPNNPTGATFGSAAWERFIADVPPDVVVAVDEAYAEYVLRPDFPRVLEDVAAGRPVVVVRSFSKAYGLAGLRLGYGVAAAPLRRRVGDQLQQFNTSRLAQAAALAALSDEDHLARCVAMNAAGRRFLRAQLFALGLPVPPSEANFLLVRGPHASGVCRGLRERGVLVKPLDGYGMPEAFRVSIGRPEDNDRFVDALSGVLALHRETSHEGRT